MPLEQFAERIGIARNVPAEQLLVGYDVVISPRTPTRLQVGRLARLGQGVTARRLLVRFRRFLPPPWCLPMPQDGLKAAPRGPRDPMIVNDQDVPWTTTP